MSSFAYRFNTGSARSRNSELLKHSRCGGGSAGTKTEGKPNALRRLPLTGASPWLLPIGCLAVTAKRFQTSIGSVAAAAALAFSAAATSIDRQRYQHAIEQYGCQALAIRCIRFGSGIPRKR